LETFSEPKSSASILVRIVEHKKSKQVVKTYVSSYSVGVKVKVKVKQSLYRPELSRVFQEFKVPRFHDNGTRWW